MPPATKNNNHISNKKKSKGEQIRKKYKKQSHKNTAYHYFCFLFHPVNKINKHLNDK